MFRHVVSFVIEVVGHALSHILAGFCSETGLG